MHVKDPSAIFRKSRRVIAGGLVHPQKHQLFPYSHSVQCSIVHCSKVRVGCRQEGHPGTINKMPDQSRVKIDQLFGGSAVQFDSQTHYPAKQD